jgi:hypothetical protein
VKVQTAKKPFYGPLQTSRTTQMLMIAAHGWDIAGAACWTSNGFITREGQAIYPLSIAPNFIATDILDMAEQLVATYRH